MKCTGFGATGKGKVRDHNEDRFLVDDELGLYLVCDGMGGHQAGAVAAQRAVEYLRERIGKNPDILERFRDEASEDSEVISFIEDVIQAACAEISRLAASQLEHLRMGTTLTLLLQLGSRAVMGHVGDSRLYLVRDEQVHQLSDDHTYASELMRMGAISPEEVRNHTYSHVLTRSVGPKEVVRVDTLLFDLLPDDLLVLCTDGLSYYLESGEDLLEVLACDDLKGAPSKLVELANSRGGRDNASVVVVSAEAKKRSRTGEERETIVLKRLEALRQMPAFSGLQVRDLLRLVNVMDVVEVKAGADPVTEAGHLRAYWLLLSGRMATNSSELKAGDCFGLESMAGEASEIPGVRAVEDSVVAMLPWKEIDRLARRRPRLGYRVFRNLVCDLAAGTRRRDSAFLSTDFML